MDLSLDKSIIDYIKHKNFRLREKLLKHHIYDKTLLFKKIHIETNSFCNRSCSFCPQSEYDIAEKMDDETFSKIVKDLKNINFDGLAGLYMRNEPLIDKKLSIRIKELKEACPDCVVYLSSNGDLIDIEKIHILFSNGLGSLGIQAYDGQDQIIKFEEMIQDFLSKNEKIIFLKKKPKSLYGGQYIWITDKTSIESNDSEESIQFELTNRAGNVKNLDKVIKPLPLMCDRPFKQLCITAAGKAVLCSSDWLTEVVVGDVRDTSLNDIWFGEKLQSYRENLANYNRNQKLCLSCSYRKSSLSEKQKMIHLQ